MVGAGAAGLATAIFTRRANPRLLVRVVDGAARPGAKILVSGGSRCNITNAVVSDADYWGGRRTVIRRVLARLTVPQTIRFFEELSVRLKEEPGGKLFPVSNRSRDVLEALLREARDVGIELLPSTRVHDVRRSTRGFTLSTARGPFTAERLVLATGGLSLPKTGSDGGGLAMARALGHTIVETTPALAPLVLEDPELHAPLSGIAQPAELIVRDTNGGLVTRIRGALLWTHFGISGPAALDVSRHLLRARLNGGTPVLSVSFLPGRTFEAIEQGWQNAVRQRPRASIGTVLAELVPHAVADALAVHAAVTPATRLAELTRPQRRALVHALTGLTLRVRDSRGYNYAEATAGGVSLDEINPSSMASRTCQGLHLVGEMLDVDGRLGGFNFQWAWASAKVAGDAIGGSWP